MHFFNVCTIDQVREKLKKVFNSFSFETEFIDIADCINRTLAVDIISKEYIPSYNRSTVDGYAVISDDIKNASNKTPSILTLKGEVSMGESTDIEIIQGSTVYVPTGGMIPSGADAVVMIEYSKILNDGSIAINAPVTIGENIIQKGDDVKPSHTVLTKGKKLTSQDIGLLAALGISKPLVFKKPKFFIISTGDEIVDIHEKNINFKVRDINTYTLLALVNNSGGTVVERVLISDDIHTLKEAVKRGLNTADIVVISGGSSVGIMDYTYDVINSFEGQGVFVHGISIKPGKPTIIGECIGKPVFGLPGHPVSAIVLYSVVIDYFLNLAMNTKTLVKKTKARLMTNIHPSPGRTTYQMVKLVPANGSFEAIPVYGKSGMITLLTNANGYVIIDENVKCINKGEDVDVYYL